MLIEAVVAVALVAIGTGCLLATMLLVMKPANDERETAQLAGVAENVLTDIRAASGYDLSVLDPIAGSERRFTIFQPVAGSSPLPITATVTFQKQSASYLVTVAVTDPNGNAFETRTQLINEAPHPGATLTPQPVSSSNCIGLVCP
jgi:type II secretory pathway pseudopilin PulG